MVANGALRRTCLEGRIWPIKGPRAANHGPPERGRQSGGRTARESTSGADSGIGTRKGGRQGRRTRPGPTAGPKTVADLTSSTERRSREYGVRHVRERGDRACERERTEARSPRTRHVEANANPSWAATVVRKVGHLGVGQHRPVRCTWMNVSNELLENSVERVALS